MSCESAWPPRTHQITVSDEAFSRGGSGWVQNTALSELSAEKAKDSLVEKMRKDLKAAFELAAEHHDVEHYKQILKSFQEEQIAQEEARKQAAATPKRSKKGKGKAAGDDDDGDADEAGSVPRSTKSKKRKAEDDASVSTGSGARRVWQLTDNA